MQKSCADYRQPEIQIEDLIVIVFVEEVAESSVDDDKGEYISAKKKISW